MNSPNDIFDMIIIGAGPGGLSAAIYAARAKMKFKIFEAGLPGGQMNNTDEVDNYPGIHSLAGMEMAQTERRKMVKRTTVDPASGCT